LFEVDACIVGRELLISECYPVISISGDYHYLNLFLTELHAPLTFGDHGAEVVRHDNGDSLLDGNLLNRVRVDTVGVV